MFDDTDVKGAEWPRPVVCDGSVYQDYFLDLPPGPVLSEWKRLRKTENEDGGDEEGTLAELSV